jgi:CBS domain-containing protein
MIGQGVGWAFIVMGAFMAFGHAVPFFGRGIGGGIWLGLIGMFLRNAAVQHQAGHALAEELAGVRVSDLMRTRGAWVDARTPATALPSMFIQNEQRAIPVFDGERFVGLVTEMDLRRAASNPHATAHDAMTPLERLTVTTPDTEIVEALRALGRAGASDLPVLSNGALAGVLFERDITRWLEQRAAAGRPLRPSRHSHA